MARPGWYPDPWDPRRTRWWDGTAWTAHVGGGATSSGLPPLSGPPPTAPPPTVAATTSAVPPTTPAAADPYGAPAPVPARTAKGRRGLVVGAASLVAIALLAIAVGATLVLGGGDDGRDAPPDLSDVAVGSDADEDVFCDDVERLAVLRDTASPAVWAEAISRMAAHAHDDESEDFARVSLTWFRWVVDGQRSQALFDEFDDAADAAPDELCDSDPFFFAEDPSADYQRLEAQSERLADAQDLDQPRNRFFVDYGMATVVFTDPTEDELVEACEAWGDQPYQSLAEDGLLILGKSDDDIDVLEDPVVVRTGVDDDCRLLDPLD